MRRTILRLPAIHVLTNTRFREQNLPSKNWACHSTFGTAGSYQRMSEARLTSATGPAMTPASRAIFRRSAALCKRPRREVDSALPRAGRHGLRRSSGRSTVPSPNRWTWSCRTPRRCARGSPEPARTGIAYRDKHAARLGLTGADAQFARSLPDLAHRFNGVHDQVQHQCSAEKPSLAESSSTRLRSRMRITTLSPLGKRAWGTL
jgi:hypothetical protein